MLKMVISLELTSKRYNHERALIFRRLELLLAREKSIYLDDEGDEVIQARI